MDVRVEVRTRGADGRGSDVKHGGTSANHEVALQLLPLNLGVL